MVGHTFGSGTHRIRLTRSAPTKLRSRSQCVRFNDEFDEERIQTKLESASLPDLVTRKKTDVAVKVHMIPGYTGFVPGRLHTVGNTFAMECSNGINNFFRIRSGINKPQTHIGRLVETSTLPKLEPLTDITRQDVSWILKQFQIDNYDKLADQNRLQRCEAALPGYAGHIPRIIPTLVAVGKNFQMAKRRALETFHQERVNESVLQAQETGSEFDQVPLSTQQVVV